MMTLIEFDFIQAILFCMAAGRVLHVSYSSMEDFRNCPRYYWYKRIKKIERPEFNIHFLIGHVFHMGVFYLFKYPKSAVNKMLKYYDQERKAARKEYPEMGVDLEQELVFWREGCRGMLRAYRSRYMTTFRKTKLIANEVPINYKVSKDLVIVGKLDNIIADPKRAVHELKTAKGIDEQRVLNVQTDPQTSLYYWVYNRLAKTGEKLKGVVYDIIKKPSIRQKQSESKSEYIERLGTWYESMEGGIKFHRDRFDKPLIAGEAVFNTVLKVGDEMRRYQTKDDFYQDFSYCIHEWGPCAYYQLCHRGGETKENLKLYRSRKPYKMEDK